MCGRYNVIDSPQIQRLCEILGIELHQLRLSPDISPASVISIVRQTLQGRLVSDAVWWLMLDPDTGKPTKYTSFNSRADKLHVPRSLAYRPYRQSRCIIPASAFVEGLGDGKTYHKIELEDQAIAFGGLYREYINPATGERHIGASIITLGPLAPWSDVHPDSMPLMLPSDNPEVLSAWLDPQVTDVNQFEPLLSPQVGSTQLITPIDRPSKWRPIGDCRKLAQDGIFKSCS